jgi:hypothetical protein
MRINKSLITYQPSSGAGSGTVTSVALSAPTGFTVSGSPITSAGTLALAFTTGYGIPPLMTGNSGKFLTTNGTTMSWVNIAGTDVTGAALTENDDTNVTMTLGGTPSTALLRSVSMSLGWTGQLAVGRGGTGTSNLTGVVIGNNTSAMTAITGTSLQIFRVNSAGSGSEFFTSTFLSNPMTTSGDIIYGGVSGAPTRLGANTTPTNMFLRSVSSGAPSWESISSADITGAALTRTNDTNVTLTLGGSPSTALLNAASLTLGWSGTLAVGRGGTGASTLTGVVIGNATSAMTAVAGTSGQFLRRNTANTAYEFRTLQGGDIAGSELTFTNDTNVQMSLGGTPASALLQPVSITLGWTGQLAVARGGTGASTLTGVLIGNGTSAVSGVTGTSGQLLRRNVANTAYEFFTASLISGNGVADRVAKWTSSTNLIDSQIIDNGANVGIGISPSHKLDVNGNIGISGTIFLSKSGTSNVIYDSTGGTSILIGSSATATTYYLQTTHYFQSRAGVDYLTLSSSVIDVKSNLNITSGNYLTWGGSYGANIPTISGTSGSGSNGFLQFYPAGSTSGVKMALRRTGQLALTSYTSSSAFTGTSVATLAVDAAGDVITIAPQQTTASGTYTPTWTGLANVDSVTSFSSQYMRVGDTVTVSGWVTINATADNTPTSLSFSLPINSDTSVVNRLNGTGVAQGGGAAACLSGYGTNFGEFEVLPPVDTAVNYSFHFTYRIV